MGLNGLYSPKKGWICIIWLSKEVAGARSAHTWIRPCPLKPFPLFLIFQIPRGMPLLVVAFSYLHSNVWQQHFKTCIQGGGLHAELTHHAHHVEQPICVYPIMHLDWRQNTASNHGALWDMHKDLLCLTGNMGKGLYMDLNLHCTCLNVDVYLALQ